MDVRQEIARRVDSLPPDLQAKVLGFVASLSASKPTGEQGVALRQFTSFLDPVSAQEMILAIEEECERLEGDDW